MKHKIRHTGPSKHRQCGGKNCYPSRQQADMVRAEKEIMQPELQLSIYACLVCGQWHLTRRSTHKPSL